MRINKNNLLFLFLGLVGTITVMYIRVSYQALVEKGAFVQWELLDSPKKFEKIVDANSGKIWARSTDRKLYARDIFCASDTNCMQWIEVKKLPHHTEDPEYEEYDLPMEKALTCENYKLYKEPPGTVIECVRAPYHGSIVSSSNYYALLDDGTIWYWITPVENDYIGPLECLLPVALGFLMGSLVFVFIVRRQEKKSNNI